MIISSSVDNSYLLFGFKETKATLNRMIEVVDVKAIESTTVKPKFDIYPPGNRLYNLNNWDDMGLDFNLVND